MKPLQKRTPRREQFPPQREPHSFIDPAPLCRPTRHNSFYFKLKGSYLRPPRWFSSGSITLDKPSLFSLQHAVGFERLRTVADFKRIPPFRGPLAEVKAA
ncbi:hypothetical protein EVAR_29926_1 [Eumeta japonica]|uniref:Uncharacterized protein n=1 Tax=Eumeta variegata TaxID=151549 RepID=A0A4C1V787_EUMVA|nr:hypothetical protein EVAR_29926_1 [Eumeta japonica]